MSQTLTIQHFRQLLDTLEEFIRRENCLFNLTKFFELLQLSKDQLEDVIEMLFRFQTFFTSTFDKFSLTRQWKNNQTYLKLIPQSNCAIKGSSLRKIIELTPESSQLLNDVIYYFEHVKIGKGFDIKTNGSDLTQKVKILKKIHPYFFESRGNGCIYPTKLASQIGNMISIYKKGNREIQDIEIDEYLITVR
jgi:hypothetical protein